MKTIVRLDKYTYTYTNPCTHGVVHFLDWDLVFDLFDIKCFGIVWRIRIPICCIPYKYTYKSALESAPNVWQMCLCIFVVWFLYASIFLFRSSHRLNPYSHSCCRYRSTCHCSNHVEWWKCGIKRKCRNVLCMHCCYCCCCCSLVWMVFVCFWLDIAQPQCGSAICKSAHSRKKMNI